MKVLFIGHYLVVEEYQKKLKELTKYKDIELTLIVPKAWTEGSRLVKLEKIKDKDYKIIPVNVLFRDHIGGYFPPLLFKYILNIKPDIIHIDEEPFSLCAFYATFIGKLIKAKIIFSTFENIKRNYKFPLGLINRYILNTADYAICMNKEAESILIQRGFKKEIAIIPQVGVDLALFKHIDASKIKEKYKLKNYFVIGYIGRFVKEKGILTLIEAVKNLDYTDFKLLLIGDGYLKKEIKKMDLASKILFIKPVPQSKLVEYLNCMDVLVLPSETTKTWKEQFGRVLIEAMSTGVPVIGSSSGAIPEIIQDAGLIFKEKDPIDLKNCIELLIKNPKLKKRFQELGRRRVEKYFTHKYIASKIYQVYQKVYYNK